MKIAGSVLPWRDGNRFRLLVDGPTFFPALLEAIDQARHAIDLELYLVEDGACAERLVSALVAAADHGVRVRCLFDGFGCMNLGQEARRRLAAAGVEVRNYNPLALRLRIRNLHRDHRKILLVDGRLGFVGGAGATDDFWNPEAPQRHWHEVMVQMEGPLLEDWQRLFEAQWQNCQRRHIWEFPLPERPPRLPPRPDGRDGLGRVAYSAARQHRDILHGLMRQIRRAERRIVLATPYFLPTGKVRRALMRAAHRGVEVRLLLTGQRTDHPPVRYAGQRYYHRLLRAGVRIHEYQPHFSHMKMVLVDDWVTVGSCNFDRWNLRWNLEANLEAIDSDLLQQVEACFERDFGASREITLAAWQQRPWSTRLRQHFWGWLDRAVLYFVGRGL